MGLSRWVIHLVSLIVRVVGFEEPSTCSRLVLRHLFFLMRVHLLVRLDVARDAQQFDVLRVVRPRLHAVRSIHGVSAFDGLDVMAIDSGGYESFAPTAFT